MSRHDNYGSYRQTVAPSATFFTAWLDDAKAELDITSNDSSQDSRIIRLLGEAAAQIERDARQVIATQTWQLYLDEFPCWFIELRRVPVTAVNFVKYTTGGTLTTLSTSIYETDLISEPARIAPVYGQIWPTTDCKVNAVQIEFIAGAATAAAVKPYVKGVILALTRGLYHGCDQGDNYWSMIQRLQTFGAIV